MATFAAFAVLMLGGLLSLLAGAAETCTQNAPDSLYLFPLVLLLNLAGMAVLCWRPQPVAVMLAALLPAAMAVRYSLLALELAGGTPACTLITGDPAWEPSGNETVLALGWGATALIFWIGLAYALTGGYRPQDD